MTNCHPGNLYLSLELPNFYCLICYCGVMVCGWDSGRCGMHTGIYPHWLLCPNWCIAMHQRDASQICWTLLCLWPWSRSHRESVDIYLLKIIIRWVCLKHVDEGQWNHALTIHKPINSNSHWLHTIAMVEDYQGQQDYVIIFFPINCLYLLSNSKRKININLKATYNV